MANPRDALSLLGIRPLRVTLTIDNSTITASDTEDGGSAQVGLAVKLSADNTVALVQADDQVLGQLISVNVASGDLRCSVQVGGFISFLKGTNYSGAVGGKIVGDVLVAAEGYVKHLAAASAGSAAEINALAAAQGVIYDDSDTDEVVVWMG